MAEKNATVLFKTPMCRLMYAKGLFVASAYQNDEKALKKFTPSFIFPVTDKPLLEKYVLEVLIKMPKGLERAKAGLIRSPILAGDGKEARFEKGEHMGEIKPGLGPDKIFIRPSAMADKPPFVIWKDPNIQETEENVYSGCYGHAVINVFEWKDGKGLSFGLAGFQKHEKGERLGSDGGGRANPNDFYEKVADDEPIPESAQNGAGASGLFG